MKNTFIILAIFILLGLFSMIASFLNGASMAIVIFHLGYLVLAAAFGYILWKKSHST